MAMFNSYVCLQEGNGRYIELLFMGLINQHTSLGTHKPMYSIFRSLSKHQPQRQGFHGGPPQVVISWLINPINCILLSPINNRY